MDYTRIFVLFFMRISNVYGTIFPHNFSIPTLSTTTSAMPVIPRINTTMTPNTECITGPSVYYRGSRNFTEGGIPCQRWDVITPHQPKHIPNDGGHHNYCRNPDRDIKGTWCYTIDPAKRWDYCGIPKCADHNSTVIWTRYDENEHSSHLIATNADPEYVSRKLKAGVYIDSYPLLENQTWSEIYALAADHRNHRVIFADRQSKIVGFQDLKTNLTRKSFDGIAFSVENLAYDWVTGNVYWADSSFNWIVVGDPTGNFYKPIYRNESYFVHAVAVHSPQRKLFFSLVNQLTDEAKLCVSDLSGRNVSVLLRSPDIRDVLGLVVDYTDDRLYFTEFTGLAGRVSSCNLDGTNRIIIESKGGAQFWDVAAYLDYLYVTDLTESNGHYPIRIISKEAKKELNRYSMQGLSRGVAVLSADEERDYSHESIPGGCNNSALPECQHICLPQRGGQRECACSMGYRLYNGHQCRAVIHENESLLIVDEGQGKIFQLPIRVPEENRSEASLVLVELPKTDHVISAAVSNTGDLYWSDRANNALHISTIGPNKTSFGYENTSGSEFVADQCTKNVFFLDPVSQSIRVMSRGYVKTLVAVDGMRHNIQMLAHDIRNQKLYWTDTRHTEGMGQVWRMNTDGSGVELVFSQLNWPRGIVVDHRRDSLFISEARTGMIYEQPLSLLHPIRTNSPRNITRQFDLAGHVPRHRIFINDIKVFKDHLYFFDDTDHYIEMFDLNSGPASMQIFGPKNFVSISNLAIYSPENRNTGIDCGWSACVRNNPCHHLCVDVGRVNNRRAKCLCGDIANAESSTRCDNNEPSANHPPSFQNTCPGNQELIISTCQTESKGWFPEPKWVDDHTATNRLNLSSNLPKIFKHGTYPIVYTATDEHGATSECSFSVVVRGIKCIEPPKLPSRVSRAGFSCGKQVGSVLKVECRNKPGKETFEITCVENNLWIPQINISDMCVEPVESASALGAGGTVGICLALIILICGLVFAALMTQRKGSAWLVKINFPKIWKRKTDTVQINLSNGLHGHDGENGVDMPEIITTMHPSVA